MGMDGVELMMAVEEAYGCSISDADAGTMRTPRDLIDWLVAEQARGGLFKSKAVAKPQSVLGRLFRNAERRDRQLETRRYSREEIRDSVFAIIQDHLGVERVWEDARFIEDLGCD